MAEHQLPIMEEAQSAESPLRDVSLHPYPLCGQIQVCRFEVESLYEIDQKLCSQVLFLKQRIREFEGELSSKLETEKRKNVEKDREITLLKHKINQLMSQQELQQLRAELERTDTMRHAHQTDCFNHFEAQNAELKDQIQQMHTVLQTVQKRLEETVMSDKEKELEKKLKHMEALNDLLMLKEKGQEKMIKKMKEKLKTLTEKEGDRIETVTIKKCGRFEIKERHLECSRCHEAFTSEDEMNSSHCYYHPTSPVREVTDKGVKYTWRCCDPQASCKKMLPGCTQGKHRISNKRARLEG